MTNTVAEEWEKQNDDMETGEFGSRPKLFISPIENFLDEFDGNSKDLQGLFKIPQEISLREIYINKFVTVQKTNLMQVSGSGKYQQQDRIIASQCSHILGRRRYKKQSPEIFSRLV